LTPLPRRPARKEAFDVIDLLLEPLAPMSCVTTVAGTVSGQPRFILELHTPDDDIRIELCNLQTVAFLRRAAMALHRDALQLLDRDDLRSRVFHYEPGPEPIPLWRVPPSTVP